MVFAVIGPAWRALWRLRRERFDLAVNFLPVVSWTSAWRMAFLFSLLGVHRRVGRDTAKRGFFYTQKVPENWLGERHELEWGLEIAQALGCSSGDRRIDLAVDPEVEVRVHSRLEKAGVSSGTVLIGVHPGGVLSRRWPLDSFAEVIEALQRSHPVRCVVTGGPDDVALYQRLRERVGDTLVNMTGDIPLRESVAVIKRCQLYISNDTGPMHIAAVLGTPLVVLQGAAEPFSSYDPSFLSSKVAVFRRQVSCAPCFKDTCTRLDCLRTIRPDKVIAAARDFLERGTPP